MFKLSPRLLGLALAAVVGVAYAAYAQPPFMGGGPSGGVPNAPDLEIVKDFDQNGDGRLDTEERQRARASLKTSGAQRGPRRGPPGGGRGGERPAGKPGARVEPGNVQNYPNAGLYDKEVLRTVFLQFAQQDWEQELADFKPTDVRVPAELTVDGTLYEEVGVSFRGASSFFMVPAGSKRSLNISMDYGEKDQRLYGYKTLNLLNCNGDPSMMSSMLYSDVAGQKIATPKVNFVNVVINGRSWGVYANVQQFNKDFIQENFETKKGARWKVSGNPRGDAGLRYLGEDLEPYRARFEIKSKDKQRSWRDLVNLCKVLNETPAGQLETALRPILDIDGALWFLAVDVALINSDGYLTRASDYSIYQNPGGVFHILPHDMNEAFQEQHGGGRGGPGGPRGERRGGPPGGFFGMFGGPSQEVPGQSPPAMEGERNSRQNRGRHAGPGGRGRGQGGAGGGYELDPLVGIGENRFPLRQRLLAVPKFREQYLKNLRDIAVELLDWDYLGPRVESTRDLIKSSMKSDTRKLVTYTQFISATNTRTTKPGSIREFADKRSEYLLSHPAIKKLDK